MKPLLIVIVVALTGVQGSPAPRPLTDPDAYAIYSVLIPSAEPARMPGAKRLVIQDSTEIDAGMTGCPVTGPDVKGAWAEAIENFDRQNASRWRLRRSLTLPMPYDLERRDEIMAHFGGSYPDGWRTFYAAHPETRGYVRVSAVGFDKSRTRALVYVSHFSGNVAAGGAYHFLERQDGVWTEVKPDVRTCFWIS